MKSQFPNVEMEFIDMMTEQGQKTIQRYGIISSPGMIVNGEIFSMGGLDQEKLMKKIEELLQ